MTHQSRLIPPDLPSAQNELLCSHDFGQIALENLFIISKCTKSPFCDVCICRSNDTDETTKRKVNLVFEKIQTLKSRATASSQGDSKVGLYLVT